MNNNEIRSLIRLLDDESAEIAAVVREKLLEAGVEALPFLEEASETAPSTLRERIRVIVNELAVIQTKQQLGQVVAKGPVDLEEGALLLARYGYPGEDLRWCSRTLDELSRELDSKLDTRYEPAEIVSTLATFFAVDKGFRGDLEDYYNPENSYINRVLEKGTGLPIALCTIYMLVANRLNIPLSGVGMPGHFLVKYAVGGVEIFLDPFRGGKLLSREDCREFLELTGLGFRDEYLQTVNNQQILERTIRNLMLAYRQGGELERLPALREFLEVLLGESRS